MFGKTRVGEVALKLFAMPDWLEVTGVRIEAEEEVIEISLPMADEFALPQPAGCFRIVIEVACEPGTPAV